MTTLKEQILTLREQGLSFREIELKLNCSKSTISYHISTGQKEKTQKRQQTRRTNNPLASKIYTFKGLTPKQKKGIHNKITHFFRGESVTEDSFTVRHVTDKYKDTCYLTGRKIDITNPSSYNLDHVIPRAKGGLNTFENCGLACSQANQAKRDMSVEEFFQLCIDVVKHNKLKID